MIRKLYYKLRFGRYTFHKIDDLVEVRSEKGKIIGFGCCGVWDKKLPYRE